MNVGDKVVCIRTYNVAPEAPLPIIGKDPVKGDILTVRAVSYRDDSEGCGVVLLFEEIKNINHQCGLEYAYEVEHFRKIDTRPELSELTDEMILTAPTTKELQTA